MRQFAEESGRATERRILDAAIECFTRFGNDKTTLTDVARTAGLSRQTIYRYFPDRAALLEAVDRFEEDTMRTAAEQLGADSASFEDFIASLAAREAAETRRYRTRHHLAARDRGLFHSLFLSQSRSIERFSMVVRPQLVAAADRGELRPGLDMDQAAEWIAIALAAVNRLAHASTFDLDDPDEVGRFVASHACHGLVALPSPPARRRQRAWATHDKEG
jgi:AcrR family transcriptional regulator